MKQKRIRSRYKCAGRKGTSAPANHESKIHFFKKNFRKAELDLPCPATIYMAFTLYQVIISKREVISGTQDEVCELYGNTTPHTVSGARAFSTCWYPQGPWKQYLTIPGGWPCLSGTAEGVLTGRFVALNVDIR